MQIIISFLQENIILLIFCIILLILYISNSIKSNKLRKSYGEFMSKLGNGNNLEEMMKNYINKVVEVENNQNKLAEYCNKLDNDLQKCVQKVGIVRYNAFKDSNSDLSFSIALLDEKNNGIILNSIYGRDNSTIYAKPIKDGVSTYILSDEEKQALDIAMHEPNNITKNN